MSDLPSPSKPNKLKTNNVAALYDLKAEFLNRKKTARQSLATSTSVHNVAKKGVLTLTNKERNAKEAKKMERTARIKGMEEGIRKEEEERERQRKVLEEKAKIYERMSKGETIVNEDGKDVEFLVNFSVKKREIEVSDKLFHIYITIFHVQEAEEEERRKKELRNSQRSRFEDKEDHYDYPEETPILLRYDPSEEPGRVYGASHIPLSRDEDERQAKIKELKDISKETETVRRKRKKELDDKKRAEKEKVRRFRQRLNLSPLPSTSEEEESEDEVPGPSLEDIPLPPTLPPIEKPAYTKYGDKDYSEERRYTMWKQKEQDKRDQEFAPPSSYYRY